MADGVKKISIKIVVDGDEASSQLAAFQKSFEREMSKIQAQAEQIKTALSSATAEAAASSSMAAEAFGVLGASIAALIPGIGEIVAIGLAVYAVFKFISSVIGSVISAIGTLISAIQSVVSFIASTLLSVVVGVFNGIVSSISNMVNFARWGFNSIVDFASDMASRVWDILSNLEGQVEQSFARMFHDSKMADALGAHVIGFERMAFAAKNAGQQVGTIETAIGMVDRAIGRAMEGGKANAKTQGVFAKMGLDPEQLQKLNSNDALTQLANKIDAIHTASARAAALQDLGFSRGGGAQIGKMLALLHEIHKTANDVNQDFSRLYDINALGYAKIELATEAINKMKLVWQDFIDNIAVKLSGYLVNIQKELDKAGINAEFMGKLADRAFDLILTGAAGSAAFIKMCYQDLPGTMKVIWDNVSREAEIAFGSMKISGLQFIVDLLGHFKNIGPSIVATMREVARTLESVFNVVVTTIASLMQKMFDAMPWKLMTILAGATGGVSGIAQLRLAKAGVQGGIDKLKAKTGFSLSDAAMGSEAEQFVLSNKINQALHKARSQITNTLEEAVFRNNELKRVKGDQDDPLNKKTDDYKFWFDRLKSEYKEFLKSLGDITEPAKKRAEEIQKRLDEQGQSTDKENFSGGSRKALGYAERINSVAEIWGLQQANSQVMTVEDKKTHKLLKENGEKIKEAAAPKMARASA